MAGSGATFVITSVAAGAAIGAGTAAITGGNVGQGAMFGAVAGGAGAGFGGGFTGGGQGVFGPGGFSGTTLFGLSGNVVDQGILSTASGFSPGSVTAASGGGGFFSNIGFGDILGGLGGLAGIAGEVGETRGQARQFAFKSAEAGRIAGQTAGVTARQAEEFKRAGSRTAAARRARIAKSQIRGSTGQPLKVSTQLEDEIAFQNAIILEGGQFKVGSLLNQQAAYDAQRASLLSSIPRRVVGGTLKTAGKVFS
jgi:hypothetical protein